MYAKNKHFRKFIDEQVVEVQQRIEDKRAQALEAERREDARVEQQQIDRQDQEQAAQQARDSMVKDVVQEQAEAISKLGDEYASIIEESKQPDAEFKISEQTQTLLGDRIRAIESLEEDGEVFVSYRALSDEEVRMLNSKDINRAKFDSCEGVAVQQQAHKEMVEVLKCATHLDELAQSLDGPSRAFTQEIAGQIVELADIGLDFNAKGYVDKAFAVVDVCQTALDFGKAVYQGARDVDQAVQDGIEKGAKSAGYGFIHLGKNICKGIGYTIVHPIKTCHFIWQKAVELNAAMEYLNTEVLAHAELLVPGVNAAMNGGYPVQTAHNVATPRSICLGLSPKARRALADWSVAKIKEGAQFAVNHPCGAIKNVTAFAAEWVIGGLPFDGAMKVTGIAACKALSALQRLKHLRAAGKVNLPVPIAVAVTPEGIPLRLGKGTAMFMEGAGEVIRKASKKAVPAFEKVFKGVRVKKVELLYKDYKKLFKLGLKNIDRKLCPHFRRIKVKLEALKHILGVEIRSRGGKVVKILGGHHDPTGELRRKGLIKFVSKPEVNKKTGVIRGLLDAASKRYKTLFPSHWNEKKVIEKICEAAGNIIKDPVLQNNGKWRLVGKTLEGIEIEIIVKKCGELVTAYPLWA